MDLRECRENRSGDDWSGTLVKMVNINFEWKHLADEVFFESENLKLEVSINLFPTSFSNDDKSLTLGTKSF